MHCCHCHSPSPGLSGYLELLALAAQDVDLVGLEGSHVLLHLNSQLLGVGPLLWQLLWEMKAGEVCLVFACM